MSDTDSTVEATGKIAGNLGDSAKNMERNAKSSGEVKENLKEIAKLSGVIGSSNTGGNVTTSTTPTVVGGGNSGNGGFFGSGGGYSGFGSNQSPYTSPMPYGQNYSNTRSFASMALSGAMGITDLIAGIAGMFPTSQEALTAEMGQKRLGFYGATDPRIVPTDPGIVQGMANMGTTTDPLDALFAAGSGASKGLLPGLSNFYKKDFSGITGGAALMSNLVPGMGLQGGMNAMAALNQASSVNRLRMIGINTRTSDGTSMSDIPNIVDDLYKMLKQSAGGDFSPNDIAVSAMSGNALDSILKQYFPSPDLRQAILAGLVQQARTKESLNMSGTLDSLIKTGGSTASALGISQRSSAEFNMINALTPSTISGLNQGTASLSKLYNTMSSVTGEEGGLGGPMMGVVAQTKTGLETIAGGRGGNVGAAFDLGGTTIGNLLGKALQLALLIASDSEGPKSSAGTYPTLNIVNNIAVSNGVTTETAEKLGITIGNAINAETLAQLAAART